MSRVANDEANVLFFCEGNRFGNVYGVADSNRILYVVTQFTQLLSWSPCVAASIREEGSHDGMR